MYINIGKDVMIKLKDIVFIIDYKYTKNNKANKKFLLNIQKNYNYIDICDNDPKSIILVKENNRLLRDETKKQENYKAYLSSISSSTLCKRSSKVNNIIKSMESEK